MFKKFLMLVSFTALSGVALAGMAAGCSSSSGSSNNTITPNVDAGGNTGVVENADAGTNSESGSVACYSAGDADVLNNALYTTIYPGGNCTQAEVDTFYDSCIATNDACSVAQISETCRACLAPSDGPSTVASNSPIDFPSAFVLDGYWQIASYVCLAMQLSMPQCALPWQNEYNVCPVEACQSCADDNSYAACADQAIDDDKCTTLSQVPSQCQAAADALQGTEPAFATCFGAGNTDDDFAARYHATATALCVTGFPQQ
jgi:hypothetical protein